ncbi:hypothetical protein [Oceanobacillus sp. CFH 90083]|uniref:hypothetical protein n=1 Tax=Oceanobacillus sp. CFH 90083 TaxID=2592336 RepID=UPI00128D9530|nr:hypothetical protein [Oceanobacillus sp. CFH 90083]
MSTLLWIISFLLHGISILAIYLLLKDKQSTARDKQTENVLKETLEEIQKENRMLQKLLEEDKQLYEKPIQNMERKQALLNPAEEAAEAFVTAGEEVEDLSQSIAYQDEVETSLEARILQLHANGETIDAIAKKLACGKTEAEIIIKMQDQKRKASLQE